MPRTSFQSSQADYTSQIVIARPIRTFCLGKCLVIFPIIAEKIHVHKIGSHSPIVLETVINLCWIVKSKRRSKSGGIRGRKLDGQRGSNINVYYMDCLILSLYNFLSVCFFILESRSNSFLLFLNPSSQLPHLLSLLTSESSNAVCHNLPTSTFIEIQNFSLINLTLRIPQAFLHLHYSLKIFLLFNFSSISKHFLDFLFDLVLMV